MITDDLYHVVTPTSAAPTLLDPAGLVNIGYGNPSGSVAERIKLIAFLPPPTAESSQDIACCTHRARRPVDIRTRALPMRKLKLTQAPKLSFNLENRLAGMNLRKSLCTLKACSACSETPVSTSKARISTTTRPKSGDAPMASATRDTGTMLSAVRFDIV